MNGYQAPPPPPPPGTPPPSYGGHSGWPPPSGGSGGSGYQGWHSPKPDNYLVWAILTTIFCCMPFGIVAIVHAAQVDSKWSQGDHMGAREASEQAKKWSTISAAIGGAIIALYIIAIALGAAADSSSY